MKNFLKGYWKYVLILIFGGFLFLSVIIAIGIYYPWAAAIIVGGVIGAIWWAMHNAPTMPDEYDRPELKNDKVNN